MTDVHVKNIFINIHTHKNRINHTKCDSNEKDICWNHDHIEHVWIKTLFLIFVIQYNCNTLNTLMIEMEKRHLDCNTSKVSVCKHHCRSNYCCVLQVIQRCFYQKRTWEIPLLHMWAIIFSDKRHTVATCGCVVTAQWFEGNDSSQIEGVYSSFQSSGSVKLEKQHFQLSKRCIETDRQHWTWIYHNLTLYTVMTVMTNVPAYSCNDKC